MFAYQHIEWVSGNFFPRSLETTRQKEIFDYICQNNGPDENQRAHPNLLKVDYSDLKPALEAAQNLGLCKNLRPYHFQIVRGIWKEDSLVDEIIVKRVQSLLYNKYRGDFIEFCASVQARDLLAPLYDVIDGRTFKVSVLQPLGEVCNSSPVQIAMRYLDIIGERSKYWDLQPFHFSTASQGTFNDIDTAYEVVRRKIKSLLRENYNYDFARLCAQTTAEEMMAPFLDPVVGTGKKTLVSVGRASQEYDSCVFKMLDAYIHREGLEKDFKDFKPYHLSTTAQGTYKDKKATIEVIIKACKYQLMTRYGGDEQSFLEKVTLPQLENPFYEKIAGRSFEVYTRSAILSFGESSTRIRRAYQKYRDSIFLAV